MKKKIALIFGVTGQDGAYLSKFLLKKNYIVHGVKRKTSLINTKRIDDIYEDPNIKKKNFCLHFGDVTDYGSVFNLITDTNPNEIYNLSAQSHVAVSFQIPEYTADTNALGTLRILEVIRKFNKNIKFYQAGTSELFGKVQEIPQNENTKFYPRSPYAVAKLFAHWITINYREAYKIFSCNGILFNHESPLRGETFVTQKIVKGLVKIKMGFNEKLLLGNIYSKRDWGHAQDYVEGMWKILQQKKPKDYVLATGKTYTVKFFIKEVSKKLNLKLVWKGKGLKEKAYLNGQPVIEIDKRYFRPSEVDLLIGDARKARNELKWKPKKNLNFIIDDMINYEKKFK
jgi:GDPmannose 4,6-dehydratase